MYHKLRSVKCSADCEENDIKVVVCSPWELIRKSTNKSVVSIWSAEIRSALDKSVAWDIYSSSSLVEGTLVGSDEGLLIV